MSDTASRPIGGVPYHCSACEVGWFDTAHSPSRCWMPKCNAFGQRGGVAEKCLWVSNRSTIERGHVASALERFPFLRNRLST